ncbi:MAG: KH domain-containing protein [Desulfosarcinaceae bacterium]|jgi:hypothetical protein
MKEMMQQIVERLVDFPEQVIIDEIGGTRSGVMAVTVAKADLGKVIGKHGRTAQALRTLLSATSAKNGKRMILEIVE